MNSNESSDAPIAETPDTPAADVAVSAEPAKPPLALEKALPLDRVTASLWNWVLPAMLLLSLFVIVMYIAPYLIYHWRLLDAEGEAEAIFLKRRAELKADAEHADARLDVLDKRAYLVSLGFREVARKVMPNVVNVASMREPKKDELAGLAKKGISYDPDNGNKYIQSGVGSGVIIQPGVILTNYHVVKGAQRLRVSFASGQSIGIDPDAIIPDAITDLALIKLPTSLPAGLREDVLQVAAFADSDKDVHVGDWTLAVGSPLGLRQTMTQGIISAKGRLLHMLDLVELLQTDAAINPGNSGGPLFDQMGRVVGINVAIASESGGNEGIGFAIPSNTVKRIAAQLLTHGEVRRGYLGIAMEELPPRDAKERKIDSGGVVVKELVAGEAGVKAGLKVGDVIVGANKDAFSRLQPVRHFRQLVVDVEPGAAVTLEVFRGAERLSIAITAGKRPAHLP